MLQWSYIYKRDNNMTKIINQSNRKGLNNNQLKIIAMISMLIDHIGLMFFPKIKILRYIGRLAFPIFAYMIAEGCRYTRNRKKYLITIAGMALVFQVVYFVFMNSIYQGILVNFSLAISTIFAIESFIKNKKIINRIFMALILFGIGFVYFALPVLLRKYGFAIDYGILGLFIPLAVYFIPKKLWRLILISFLLVFMALVSGQIKYWFSLLTIPLFFLYNGTRGNKKLKYMFYIFYPLHLVILYAIAYLIIFLK